MFMEEDGMRFENREQAGRLLAKALKDYENNPDVIVLGLARGGVPVAFEVAQALHAPLDVFIVRKLGFPGQEELAMGAIASGDVVVFNDIVLESAHLSEEELKIIIEDQREELMRRQRVYRGDRPPLALADRIVILIDDGIATGASMRAAVSALKQSALTKLVVAVPVAAPEICDEFEKLVDEFICLSKPEFLYGVGAWYNDFSQTSDLEVCELLKGS